MFRWFVRLNETLALGALTSKFTRAAHSFGLLTGFLLRRLFKIGAGFHFTKQTLALHFFLKRAQGLFDIIVANGNLNNGQLSIKFWAGRAATVRMWPMGAKTKRAYNMRRPACLSPESYMPTPSENLRDVWLDAMLPLVSEAGWTAEIAGRAAKIAGLTEGEQALAAPNGVADLVDHFFDRAAAAAMTRLSPEDLESLRVHERVAAGLKAWLKALEPDQEAVRKAVGFGLMPWGVSAAARRVWSISDMIWTAAGDSASDYNRQTKRVLLGAVIPSIVLYWLDHHDPDDVDQFILRRLRGAMKIGQAGGKVLGPVLSFGEQFLRRSNERGAQ